MAYLSDLLLTAAAFGAAFYCHILARRLRKFNALEGGMGAAVAVLSVQVDEMTRALEAARRDAAGSAARLESLTQRAETAATRLELMLASLAEFPEPPARGRVVRRRATPPLAGADA